jgi:hypothetical protein
MRRFSYLCLCASLVAALAPAALPAQTITFSQPHATEGGNPPYGTTVTLYANGNYLGKSVNHLIVRYLSSQYEYSYGFLVGDGNGDFPEYSLPSLPPETAALTADINGDGKADLITLVPVCTALTTPPCPNSANPLQANVTFMISNGDESFSNVGSVPLPAGLGAVQAVVGDFNKDGKPDVAIISYASYNTAGNARLIVLLNQGDETFSMKSYLLSKALFTSVVVSNLVTGDFNGDGNPDLAFAFYSSYTGDLAWLFTFSGDGQGNFAPAKRSYIFDSSFVANGHPLQAADLNGDKRTDLVINLNAKVNTTQPRIATLLSTGTGFKWASAVILPEPGATDIVVADFNKDGRPDLAYIGQTQYTQPIIEVGGVFAGNGKGGFTGPQISLFPSTTSGEEVVQGSPTATLTAMPFHTGQLPSLLVSLGNPTFNPSYFYELTNTTK